MTEPKIKNYDIVVVLWEDHTSFYSAPLPKNPDVLIETPLISIGFLYKETKKTMVIVSEIVPNEFDEANYTIIRKDAIVGVKKYGTIALRKFRR